VLGLDEELGVPLVNYQFRTDNPRAVLFDVPSLGLGAKLGVAWRFL
jgi:hypothetical protein